MKRTNYLKIEFPGYSGNENLAISTIEAFVKQTNPTIEEIRNIQVALNEAVRNAIEHAYPDKIGKVSISVSLYKGKLLEIKVQDWGIGIEDVKKVQTPLYTTGNSKDHSGMGFTLMEHYMDYMNVSSKPEKGTIVTMRYRIRQH